MAFTGVLMFGYGTSEAASVLVNNFSFEEVDGTPLTPGGYVGAIKGWTKLGTIGAHGTEYYKDTAQFTVTIPLAAPADGNQAAYLNRQAHIYQNVGALQANTLYTLTVAVGNRKDLGSGQNGGIISLYNGTDPNGTLLAVSPDFMAPAGTFQDLTITFTTGSTVSGDLTISLKQTTTANNTAFDNVRLTAVAVPEPSTFALLPLLGGAFFFRRRR